MSLTWSMALAPVVRSFYDEEPEPVPCPSRWYLPAVRDRAAFSLGCSLDVDHTGAGLDNRHGRGLARWTSETAAESLAEHLASQGPRCTESGCKRPAVISLLCGYHSHAEQAADNIETPEDAA